jgi:hypothetical protein
VQVDECVEGSYAAVKTRSLWYRKLGHHEYSDLDARARVRWSVIERIRRPAHYELLPSDHTPLLTQPNYKVQSRLATDSFLTFLGAIGGSQ